MCKSTWYNTGNLMRAFLFIFMVVMGSISLYGQGDLIITPKRIVFEGNKRTMDLNLANTGKDTATYAISIVQMRMTESGGFENITEPDPGQQFADKNIRFFPRSVTLGPNESQTIKVQLYKQNQLAPGEYRSHFYFRALPGKKPLGATETVATENGISVVIASVFGITIPVIIRVGEVNASVSISDLKFSMVNDTIPNLSLTFNRSGNMSVYGDLEIQHISSDGKETRVGIAKGIAVYTPNAVRKFAFNLTRPDGIDFRTGSLKAVFSSQSDVRPEKYAESSIQLGR